MSVSLGGSFTTDAAPPVVGASSVASAITPTSVRIHGSIPSTPRRTSQYGTTTGDGSVTVGEPAGDPPADTPVQMALTTASILVTTKTLGVIRASGNRIKTVTVTFTRKASR